MKRGALHKEENVTSGDVCYIWREMLFEVVDGTSGWEH